MGMALRYRAFNAVDAKLNKALLRKTLLIRSRNVALRDGRLVVARRVQVEVENVNITIHNLAVQYDSYKKLLQD